MALPISLAENISLPVVAAPMFILSNPDLVIAQCKMGIVGSFPALNARPAEELDVWLQRISSELEKHNASDPERRAAPYAVNQIVHNSNDRLEHDLALCVKYKVPIVITSLGCKASVIDTVHSYGGLVFHDVINNKYAKKAVSQGVDGLIAVAAGAGGHAGTTSPFALIQEIREWFDGPLLLSGSIATGDSILAALAMGADMAYMGSTFIATKEANASDEYKQAVIDHASSDIVYSNLFTGVHGNYLRPSIEAAGMDPDNLPESDPSKMNFSSNESTDAKAWRDIWGCGHGIGAVKELLPAKEVISRLEREYQTAQKRIAGI
ncbi:nitronate monooxygenase [Colwellia sp. MB02u-10]|uniref:NAD(P)H-dependent flavin oxidoreductase n=1 Tax=Colwellia sp. MB02u-10 TaxID=2759828 RepID=UPI0015F4AFC6|nr:nitronate monooxygenase family protein [Colwellia sp. MB02u-10]MBA6339612.1 nitronate monooxygenase [Colwellia sp. MB02u-10]